MSAKVISVVTPAYRCAKFLEGYYEGILALPELPQLAVITVLNAADEEERRVSSHYSLAFKGTFTTIHVIQREPIGASINRGLAQSETPFIALLDVDDRRIPGSLAEQRTTLEKANADFTYGDIIAVAAPGETKGALWERASYSLKAFLDSPQASPTQFFRRRLLEKIGGFDEQFSVAGDYDFNIRAALAGNVVKTDSPLLYYTWLDDSGSTSSNKRLSLLENAFVKLRYRNLRGVLCSNELCEAAKGLHLIQGYRYDQVKLEGSWVPLSQQCGDACHRVPTEMELRYVIPLRASASRYRRMAYERAVAGPWAAMKAAIKRRAMRA